VSYQDIIPTLALELIIVEKTEGTLEQYKDVSAQVLLLEGIKTQSLLKDSVEALNKVLPHFHLIELKA